MRRRVWVRNQFLGGPGGHAQGTLCPAIMVGMNLVVVRHAKVRRDALTWTAEPVASRRVVSREIGAHPYDFDAWGPVAAYLSFTRSPIGPVWRLALRSEQELPWFMLQTHALGAEPVSRQPGCSLSKTLAVARSLVRSEGHHFPPMLVAPNVPYDCPAADLDSLPQDQALAAVEGLISRTLSRA